MLGQSVRKSAALTATVFALAFCATTMAYAETLTEAEQSKLNSVRDEFVRALSDSEHEILIQVIPPRVLSYLLDAAAVPQDVFVSALGSQMAQALEGVSFSSVTLATEDIEVTRYTNKAGDEFVWGFAPTYFEIGVNGQKHVVEGHTLVLQDKDDWYLVRTSELQQVSILREVYPFFKAVTFPGASALATE